MSQKADLYEIIKRPIITEKTTVLQQNNQYVFEVDRSANKIEIRKAVELAFPGRKVSQVRTINLHSLTKRFGKKMGRVKATKKAIVSIIGDPIELGV
jgi:large subunit ribosomal protein L23